MANSFPIFDRLVGLETEYAIRFRPSDASASRPPKYLLFRALVLALRRQLLTVEAKHFKDGVFTATGGAVWFETERPLSDGGLIEGSTPECRGPKQVIAYQRAQDRLLAQAAEASGADGEFSLLKNDRDAFDNVYGAQENYEATLASGWQLAAWRAGLLLLLPLVLLTWMGFLLLIVGMLGYIAVASLLYYPLEVFDKSKKLALLLFGRDVAEGRET
ncbi:MAG TPA: proteasome accessory factor PafA2 family protein, partial [Pirellulaceae bacterium]|nr:proteasome accessory factor PafA2 family protein [Pirellulaceae bacterium]